MLKEATSRNHTFGEPVNVPPDPARGRHQQTERRCSKCKLVKITVHPPHGEGWRLWRWDDASWQFADLVMPECVPATTLQQEAAAT